MRIVARIIVAVLLPISAVAASQCDVQTLRSQVNDGITINSAIVVPAQDALPEHCLVDGYVATPGNSVDFRIGLPKPWNGKVLFQGVGGFAGSIASLREGLQRGYATATTDTGHKGTSGTDASWALNARPKEIDYGHRGTHVTAVASKRVAAAYFGSAPRYAYFSGCSNGGRQALMEAQRYPEDFNGIIAGDPSLGALGYVRRALTYRSLLASPDHVLPAAKLEVLSKAVLAACDASDGLADGLVGDPRRCKFDPAQLECKRDDAADCLTRGQVESVRAIYAPAKTPDGRTIHGFPVGHEAGATGWPLWISGRSAPRTRSDGKLEFDAQSQQESPTGYRFVDGFFRYMAFERDDPNYDWRNFELARDLPQIATVAEIISPTNPDLDAYRKHGGKLLMYHGWADPAISAYGTIDYFEKAAGGKQVSDSFLRLFLVPGMHHCRGGPGPDTFDALSALEDWVEKDSAPTRLIAAHLVDHKVTRTRPLCPEPQTAQYIGSGSIEDAANFRCELPSRPAIGPK